jgi:4-hydroxy-3-methylbut-2-enyl diphosphate reductase
MKVTIDPDSGFCFGVDRAIRTAEAELDAGNKVYSLGEIVHNQVQMGKLKNKGLKVVTLADLPFLKGERILFRAHGEPPESYQLAKELGITVIDATCPIVTKLQERISKSYISENETEVQIVIYGKPGHAEVAGLNGNAGNDALIMSSENDFEKINFSRPVRLFSQTTMDAESYSEIGAKLKARMEEEGNQDLVIHKSVCRQVSGRAPTLRTFSSSHEVVIFVSGRNSANGAHLYSVCKAVNEKSYLVSSPEDIDMKWFANISSVGVSGATSTPSWLIEEVAEKIKEITS